MSHVVYLLRSGLAALLLIVGLAFAAAPVAAHGNGNHGTIKVHDEAVTDPETRNEPHVCDDFWIQGANMADASGHLVFYTWDPTGNKSVFHTDNWTAEADNETGDLGFLAGPYNFPDGHYRVEAFLDLGHPGNEEHSTKSKMFWVGCEEPAPPPPVVTCPTDLQGVANEDGSVTISWTPAEGSDATRIYRNSPGGGMEMLTQVDANVTSYTDTTTDVHVTYGYRLAAVFGQEESLDCDVLEVTTIPDLPTTLGLAFASLGGIAVYAGLRRRKP